MVDSNGISMSIHEFRSLPNPKKLDCLFENQVKTFELIKAQKKTYDNIKLNQRIQYGLITGIIAAVVFLFKYALDKI